MRSRCSGSRGRARLSSARPMCRSISAIGRATTRSTLLPTILGISAAPREARRAAPWPHSPLALCRWSSARTSAARCGRRRISAASSRISRASIWFHCVALARHRPQLFRGASISPWPGRWPVAPPISPSHWRSWPDRTSCPTGSVTSWRCRRRATTGSAISASWRSASIHCARPRRL